MSDIQKIETWTGTFVVNSTDLIGLGTFPDEGPYTGVPITELGISAKVGQDGKQRLSLALTLDINGSKTYTYLTLPTDPQHEHYETYCKAWNRFVVSVHGTAAVAKLKGVALNGAILKENFVGKKCNVCYFPPVEGSDGKLDNNSQEVVFLEAAEVANVKAGTLTIKRRMKPRGGGNVAGVAGLGLDTVGLGAGVSLGAVAGAPTGALATAAADPFAASAGATSAINGLLGV
jgi:hypothetical protein